MADKSPFLADQLAFYQTHTAKMMELQAARGKGTVDPSSFMPSSQMFDELMGAFSTGAVATAGAGASPTAPVSSGSGSSSSSSSSSSGSIYDFSGASDSSPSASSGSSDGSDWGIALGGALSSHPGNIVGGLASIATGNAAGLLKSLFGIGAETVASYQAIQALREPAVGETAGNNPTADLEANAALGDAEAEAALNYDNRIQSTPAAAPTPAPTYDPVYGAKTYAPGTSPTGYNANSVTVQGQLLGYKNSVTGEVTTTKPAESSGYTPTSTYENPYDTYFSNPSNPYSGYTTYGTSEGE
jgi:hypothetical protein